MNKLRKKVALAVSGGTDSICMLDIMARKFKENIIVFTVNHNIRNESAEEALQVEKICKDYGIECHIIKIKKQAPKTAIQEFARNERYRLLSEKAKELGVNAVYLAHHRDDLYETLVSRLIHNSGNVGLSVMPQYFYHLGMVFHRPMLHLRRKYLDEYVLNNKLPVINDPSNNNDKYERTNIRNYLAKYDLSDELDKIFHKARLFRHHITYLRDEFIKQYVELSPFGYVKFPKDKFEDIDIQVKKEVLKYSVMFATGRKYPNIKEIPVKNITIGGAYIHITKKEISIFREKRNLKPMNLNKGVENIIDKRFKIIPTIDRIISYGDYNKELECPYFAKQTLPDDFISLKSEYEPECLNMFNPDPILHHKAI